MWGTFMAISSVSSSSYNSAAALLKQPATGDQKADVGLQDRDTTPERIGKLGIVRQRVAALEVERDGLRGWQNGQTHYVGCWREHRQCALTTIDFEGARRERAELALREAVAELNRLREGQEP